MFFLAWTNSKLLKDSCYLNFDFTLNKFVFSLLISHSVHRNRSYSSKQFVIIYWSESSFFLILSSHLWRDDPTFHLSGFLFTREPHALPWKLSKTHCLLHFTAITQVSNPQEIWLATNGKIEPQVFQTYYDPNIQPLYEVLNFP